MSGLKNYNKGILECGVDEAGVGSLISRVYAAAVILLDEYDSETEESEEYNLIRDSKKLSKKQRGRVRKFIEGYSVDYSVAYVEVEEIDRINILNARIKAMHKAIDGLKTRPRGILVDGDKFKEYRDPESGNIIESILVEKGDNIYRNIAAASILAKEYRDEYILELHEEYPEYGWDTNKGYGTEKHYRALRENGVTKYHRKTFNLKM